MLCRMWSGCTCLERVHGFPMGAVSLEDPGRDVHERAKGLGEQDEDSTLVSDPEGAEGTSPAMLGRVGRGRWETDGTIADDGPGALQFVRVNGQL
jgi:hypothetical protein